ncbi:uncharacterized protein [Nicotiana sylvestris]|uniref:uncharacterized protein n=1 Tax=Nicotiana sylvestris TaxID=4096 RepID=UPI00388CCC31
MTKSPFTESGERATELLGLIHIDVCGHMKIQARGGYSYFITFTEDMSSYGFVYLMKHKSESFEMFKRFRSEVEKQTGKSIKILRKLPSSTVEVQELNEVQEQVNEPVPDQIEQQPNPAQGEQDNISNEVDHNDDDPKTYEESIQSSDYEKWPKAMESEIESIKENKVVKTILKYLRRTKDQFLIYGDFELKHEGYTDASFSSDRDDRKSTSGYIFTLNGGAVSWKSSKQATVTDSVTEVEYIAASEAAKEAVWMKKFLTELGVVPSIEGAVPLLCDNTGAIAQVKEPRSHQKSKHVLRRYQLIREIIERGDVDFKKLMEKKMLQTHSLKLLAQRSLTSKSENWE